MRRSCCEDLDKEAKMNETNKTVVKICDGVTAQVDQKILKCAHRIPGNKPNCELCGTPHVICTIIHKATGVWGGK